MARVRKQPGTREALLQYAPVVVLEPQLYKGKWQENFGNSNPVQIEVGMGKGRFISTMARQNPDVNFIGVEVIEEVLLDAVKRMNRAGGIPENLRLVWINASILEELFAPGEIDRIYLNFSDPWPKKGHHRRRLTAPDRLDTYKKLLVPGGKIIQKTDNVDLFEYSVEEYRNAGLTVEFATTDLHASSRAAENITTEYEENFMREGKPICCVIVSTEK